VGGDLGGVGARGRCHFEQESRAGILVWEGRGLGLTGRYSCVNGGSIIAFRLRM